MDMDNFSLSQVHLLGGSVTHPIEPLATRLGSLLLLAGSSPRCVVTLAGRNQPRGLASSCRSIVRRHNWSCGTQPTQPRRQQPTRARPTEES